MTGLLDKKLALVTAAGQGIGAVIARGMAEVILTDRNAAALAEIETDKATIELEAEAEAEADGIVGRL